MAVVGAVAEEEGEGVIVRVRPVRVMAGAVGVSVMSWMELEMRSAVRR